MCQFKPCLRIKTHCLTVWFSQAHFFVPIMDGTLTAFALIHSLIQPKHGTSRGSCWYFYHMNFRLVSLSNVCSMFVKMQFGTESRHYLQKQVYSSCGEISTRSSGGAIFRLYQAMEKRKRSQRSIHDWDKKMGLRKSHSKTMCFPSQTRFELAHFLWKHNYLLTNISSCKLKC